MSNKDSLCSCKVFVVDGDESTRSALASLLRSFGWSARTFPSTLECLCALLGEEPDCIVSVLNMPEISSAQMMEVMASRGITVPVIVIAERQPDAELMEQVQTAGAKAILQKPYWDEDLHQAIKRVVTAARKEHTEQE